jgi:hypothetical protein
VPADRQDKAVRALGAGRPVFLDSDLLVLRSQPEYIVWVFERAGRRPNARLGVEA